jgi:UDP-N-acetylglucosamine:LPS N-acetylglucosamine transferase
MWRVLKTTVSLIVCAGGLTTYEAAFVGLPTINILQSSEWSYLFEELVEAGACRTLPPGENSLKRAVRMVEKMAANRGDLTAMHLATKGLIPEGGARRIALKLHSLLTSD